MLRSLHMKLVLVLIVLVVTVMAVAGTFLIGDITNLKINEFREEMGLALEARYPELVQESAGENAPQRLKDVLSTMSELRINKNRYYYVADGVTGQYLAGSDDEKGRTMEVSDNMLAAMEAGTGAPAAQVTIQSHISRLGDYFDVAVPILRADGSVAYIVGVYDNRYELNELTESMGGIILRSMGLGLVAAILLSFLLSKTITVPVERLTTQASALAAGDFSAKPEVYSTDEIGVLTQTFNDMADRLEATLRDVEGERNKLNTLFLHMADGVVAFESSGRLLHVNPAAQRMLGREITPDMTYGQVFPNIQVEEAELDDKHRLIEVDYSARNRILKILFAPIVVGEGDPGILAVLHDITEERKLDQSRREFVANVSHELRTPLTNIKGYTETMLNIDDLDRDTQKQFLTVVYNETDRMTRIVKDLLTLTRLDYNRMEMKMEDMDLGGLAVETGNSLRLAAEKAGLTLTADVSPGLPHILGDRERIEQVLVNIVGNAIKYNKPDGSIHITADCDESQVWVTVADTGIGVPKNDLDRVFERFYRVDKARSRESGGTGMGLSIAREITEYHGGRIVFESALGEGSRVTVRFPRPGSEGGHA